MLSGNLTATISDHLPQFSIIPGMSDNIMGHKCKFMKGTGANLTEKFLFWTIFLFTGEIFCKLIS